MLKLLVVDDEKIMRIALSMILNWTEHGFELTGAVADGIQALEAIQKSNPDIIITDLKMPNMDGLELIRRLREYNYTGKIIVLSNFDDFELVREAMKLGAIDYILKVTLKASDLITVLEKAREQLVEERQLKAKSIYMRNELKEKQLQQKNNFWKELFVEDDKYIADVVNEGAKLGITAEKVIGQLLFIKIDYYEAALSGGKIKNKKLLDFSVANIIKDTVSGRNGCEIVEIGHGRYVVLMYSDKTYDEASWIEIVRQLMQMLSLYLNLNVSVALGERFVGFEQLRLQYARCLKVIAATFYSGPNSVIHVAKTQFNSVILQTNYVEWSSKLKAAVEEGDRERLSAQLEAMIEQVNQVKCEPEELKRTFTMLLTDQEHMISKWEQNTLSIDGERSYTNTEAYKQQIKQAETLEQLKTAVYGAFQEVVDGLQQVKSKQYRKEVLRVIELMREHLHSKITLEMIASEVNMTVSYLCRIFKQDSGKSIVQYMNEMKINHAAELLKLPDVRVKEVAAAIGIDDPFYFNRLFKKYVGISPSDYRRRLFPNRDYK